MKDEITLHCNVCGNDLDSSKFYSYHPTECRKCLYQRNLARRKDKEKLRQTARDWYHRNKLKVKLKWMLSK